MIKMLRDNNQLRLSLSPYEKLYEIIIPKGHILRRIKENIDFSFVNPMLKSSIVNISECRQRSRK